VIDADNEQRRDEAFADEPVYGFPDAPGAAGEGA
jgi:hypothetical protein